MNFRVLKENDLFVVTHPDGSIPAPHRDSFGYGLFTRDTRVLSMLEWEGAPAHWTLLSSEHSKNYEGVFKYTNGEFQQDGAIIASQTLLVTRRQVVDGEFLYEQGSIVNHGKTSVDMQVRYLVDSDFKDMFEVRGFAPYEKERQIEKHLSQGGVSFLYSGLDNTNRFTTVRLFQEENEDVSAQCMGLRDGTTQLSLKFQIASGEEVKWILVVEAKFHDEGLHPKTRLLNLGANQILDLFKNSGDRLRASYQDWTQNQTHIDGNRDFTHWYHKGLLDIRMLMTNAGYGSVLVAGVPWYSVPFGRDSLIAALQTLSLRSDVAEGTLRTLAAYQGKAVNPDTEEEPGKIMHELRSGELSQIGELHFHPYYGTVDATALFLNLAADYYLWTGNKRIILDLIPSIDEAFKWIETYGDKDKDGYLEYAKNTSHSFPNQGWKDSEDSVVHKDGSLAKEPIALSEVQGYVYRAYIQWSQIYSRFGNTDKASNMKQHAERLQDQFLKDFWMEEEGAIALALDGRKNQVKSISSNMGQVLWSGILPQDRAAKVVQRLLQPDMFGFGIRTLSSKEQAYNPLSYHNGSVWPHDNGLIAAGMKQYGFNREANLVVEELLQAATHFDYRLPELFAGNGPESEDYPVPYPVSCSPQAWAAAVPIQSIQILLGLRPNVSVGEVELSPFLPKGVSRLVINGLRVGSGEMDILLTTTGGSSNTTVKVTKNTSGLRVCLRT